MTSPEELLKQYSQEREHLVLLQDKVVARLTWLEGAIDTLNKLEKEPTNADTV